MRVINAKKVAAPVKNAIDTGAYQGHELKPYEGRPGCNQALSFPSRIGNRLIYRDGTVKKP